MEKLDWTTFTKRIAINAPVEKIFNAWTTQENIEKWFLSKAKFKNKERNEIIKVGDSYHWEWFGSDFTAEGEVLENNRKNYLEFTFLGCKVSVEIKTENGEHIVELIQKEIPLDEESRMNLYVGCTSGWTFYIANLKSILEDGIDLRNKNDRLNDVINT